MKHHLAIVFVVGTLLSLCLINATANGQKESNPEMEELALTLKTAVASGLVSSREAGRVWKFYESQMSDRLLDSKSREDDEDQKWAEYRSLTMAVPGARRIRALYQPAFLSRDLAILESELELDQEQLIIARVLLDDYAEGMELASAPLQEGLSRYEMNDQQRAIKNILDRVEIAEPKAARRRVQRNLNEWREKFGEESEEASEEKRRGLDEYGQRMLDATSDINQRLTSLREQTTAYFDANQAGEEITAQELFRMAQWLQAERTALYEIVVNSLELILTEQQIGQEGENFQGALARLELEKQLQQSRMAGENVNLWSALNQVDRSVAQRTGLDAPLLETKRLLDTHRTALVASLQQRNTASIAREIKGLNVLKVRDDIRQEQDGSRVALRTDEQQDRLQNARDGFKNAAQREVQASQLVRDQILLLLENTRQEMDLLYPDTDFASLFEQQALRRGFPIEMKQQWSEQALGSALAIKYLDAETRQNVETLKIDTNMLLKLYRNSGIDERLERDQKLALQQVELLYGNGDDRKAMLEPYGEALWYGPNYEQFQQLDEQVEIALMAVLTTDQLALLPERKIVEPKEMGRGKKGDSKGGGKSDGNSGGKVGGKGGGKGK